MRLILICLIFLSFNSSNCQAQKHLSIGGGINRTIFSTDLEGAFNLRLLGEAGLTRLLSIRADFRNGPYAHGWSRRSDFGDVYNIWINGWGIDLGPRFYLQNKKKDGPYGFYIQPNLLFRKVNETFSGYLMDDNRYYLFPTTFPYVNIREDGFGYGMGLALGWKYVYNFLFMEPGFSIDFAQAIYNDTQNHRTISSHYETSDLVSFNFHFNIGLFYSKGATSLSHDKEHIPSQNLRNGKNNFLITIYIPLSANKIANDLNVIINDTMVRNIRSGDYFDLYQMKDTIDTKINFTGMALKPMHFKPTNGQHYFLRITPLNKTTSKFVKPEVGEYEIKLINKKEREDLKK